MNICKELGRYRCSSSLFSWRGDLNGFLKFLTAPSMSHESRRWRKEENSTETARATELLILNVALRYTDYRWIFFPLFFHSFFCIFPLSISLLSLPFLSFPPLPSFFPFSLLPQCAEANEVVPQLRINSKWWLHCCSSRYCIDPHLDPPLTTDFSGMLH